MAEAHEQTAAAPTAALPSLGRVLVAFLRRDALEAASYRAALLLELAALAGAVLSLGFLGRFVDLAPNPSLRPFGGRYLPFALVGLVATSLTYLASGALPRRLRQAQLAGTLEALLSTPTPAPIVLAVLPAWDLVAALARSALLLAGGALFFGARFARLGPSSLVALLLLGALGLLALLGIGLAGGALTLWLKRSDPLSFALSSFAALLAGAAYPVGVLPRFLRLAGLLLPTRHLLDGLHAVLLRGAGVAAIASALGGLALCALFYGAAGALLLTFVLGRARQNGSLGHY